MTLRSGPRLVALGSLLNLVIVGLGSAVVVDRHRSASFDPAPIAVAKQEAVNFFTLDYRHIDADLAAVAALATGAFKSSFEATAPDIKSQVLGQQLLVTAATPPDAAGLEAESDDSASVMVALDETIQAPHGTAQVDPYRVRVHLLKIDGRWRVSQMQRVRLPAPAVSYVPGALPSSTERSAVAAASREVPILLSYDYRDLPGGLSRALAETTGDFSGAFRTTFTTAIQPRATAEQDVATSTLRGASYVSTNDAGVVTCLLFVDQRHDRGKPSVSSPARQVDQDRLIVTMTKVGDQWRISSLRAI